MFQGERTVMQKKASNRAHQRGIVTFVWDPIIASTRRCRRISRSTTVPGGVVDSGEDVVVVDDEDGEEVRI